MRLHYSTTSPFARKVLATVHERGLNDKVERILTKTRPTAPDAALVSHNPLGKIPTLETDAGQWLFDSPVICEYLDTLGSGPQLLPRGGWERFRVLRTQALGDGIIDAAVVAFYERSQRPADKQWGDWIEGQIKKVQQSLDLLDRDPTHLGGHFDLGQLTVACAVSYLEFRKIVPRLEASWPRLMAWHREVARRPSLLETAPRE